MSKEREPQIYAFSIDTGNGHLICTPDNTEAYLYEDEKFDHIFHVTHEDEDHRYGYPIYRKHLGKHFDDVIKKMIKHEYNVYNAEEMTESDWINYYNAYPEHKPLPDPEEGWGNTKQDKAQKWGKFVAYLAEQIANKERGDY